MKQNEEELRYKSDERWCEVWPLQVAGKYDEAIALLKEFLEEEPDDHLILSTIGSCYYEKFEYQTALDYHLKALEYTPTCPTVQKDYGYALAMLERDQEAITVFKKLLRRGEHGVAFGKCHEGLGAARSLLNDCRAKIGSIYLYLGDKKLAQRWLNKHLTHRRKGQRCNYTLKEIKSKLRKATDR